MVELLEVAVDRYGLPGGGVLDGEVEVELEPEEVLEVPLELLGVALPPLVLELFVVLALELLDCELFEVLEVVPESVVEELPVLELLEHCVVPVDSVLGEVVAGSAGVAVGAGATGQLVASVPPLDESVVEDAVRPVPESVGVVGIGVSAAGRRWWWRRWAPVAGAGLALITGPSATGELTAVRLAPAAALTAADGEA